MAITLIQTERYTLASIGNGFAYSLTDNADRRAVFVQDDDATQFRTDWEAAEIVFPDKSQDEVMRWLWDQCDYGAASFPVDSIHVE